MPFVKPPELCDCVLSSSTDNLSELGSKEARILPQGSVLVSCIGNLGKTGIAKVNLTCNQQINAILPNKNKAMPEFIFLYCRSNLFKAQLNGLKSGTTVPIVNKTRFNSISIPLPPLPEQERIVAILDEAFAAIDQAIVNTEKNLANAKELFDSELNRIFSQKGEGWVETTLGEIGRVSMCKRILKQQTSPSGDIPFFKIGTFGKTPDAFIPKDIYEEFKEKYSFPKKGDVLISASGTIGRRVIYDGKPAYFQDSNIVWIDNNEELVLNEFLFQFYGACDWNPSKGATISRLYNDDLRKIEISFPSLSEQKTQTAIIVKLRKHIEGVAECCETKLAALEELKQSLLQKAFTGELTGKKAEQELSHASRTKLI